LDTIFYDQDPDYRQRRDNLIIVASDCIPDINCFCGLFKPDYPYLFPYSYDLFLFNYEEHIACACISEVFQNLLTEAGFIPSSPEILGLLKNKINQKSFPNKENVITPEKLIEHAAMPLTDYSVCLKCGACTNICPTCFCFEYSDIEKEDGFTRYRVHTSCSISKSPDEKILHKLRDFHQRFRLYACVGCGKCISGCPVGINPFILT
jgi:ferredoxin